MHTCQKYQKELEEVEKYPSNHLIVGENKENKGEKESLSTSQTPPLKLPDTRKKKSSENFSYAHRIAIVAITT